MKPHFLYRVQFNSQIFFPLCFKKFGSPRNFEPYAFAILHQIRKLHNHRKYCMYEMIDWFQETTLRVSNFSFNSLEKLLNDSYSFQKSLISFFAPGTIKPCIISSFITRLKFIQEPPTWFTIGSVKKGKGLNSSTYLHLNM